MVVMEGIAVTPIPVVCPATMGVPPSGVISPIPRAAPSVPSVAPEPVVYERSVNENRLYHVVGAIDILIAYDLHFHFVLRIFLHVDGGYILEYILREDGL